MSQTTSAIILDDAPVVIMERWIRGTLSQVWRAWSDPDAMTAWWGPDDFPITMREFDFRVGGLTLFDMTGPDGTVFENRMYYRVLEEPNRIAAKITGPDPDGPDGFLMDATFIEQDGGTLVRIRTEMSSLEARAQVMAFGAVELGKQTWNKLAAFVEADKP